MWRSRASDAPQDSMVGAWLLSSVWRRSIDNHAVQCRDDDQIESLPAARNAAEDAVRPDQADPFTAALPAAQQEVIALAFHGGLSHTEIAAQLGLPAGTVKGQMRLGLQALRSQMKRQVA